MANRKKLDKAYRDMTIDELMAMFNALADRPGNRVKSGRSKGCVKLAIAKFGDQILDEVKRRREMEA